MSDDIAPIPSPEEVWNFLMKHEQTIKSWFPAEMREDGFQEVVLRMLRRAENLRREPHVGGRDILTMPYVRTVAGRVKIDLGKKDARYAQLPAVTGDDGEIDEIDIADEPTADRFAMREALLKLRSMLTAGQWESLMLTGVYGLESKQAAAILLTSANAIDLRTSRARERIRATMPTLGHFGAGDARQIVLVRENGERFESPIAPRPVPLFVPGQPTRLRIKPFEGLDAPLVSCTALVHAVGEDGEKRASVPVPVRMTADAGGVWDLEFRPMFRGWRAPDASAPVDAVFLFEGEWLADGRTLDIADSPPLR